MGYPGYIQGRVITTKFLILYGKECKGGLGLWIACVTWETRDLLKDKTPNITTTNNGNDDHNSPNNSTNTDESYDGLMEPPSGMAMHALTYCKTIQLYQK